jgi:glycosyltransferase involved in cell wall biosynthesis
VVVPFADSAGGAVRQTDGQATTSHTPRDGSLRIAVLAPISWRTPPRHYGPWELFASLLTEGLVALGHHVTLFATGDSLTSAKLRATIPCGWSEDVSIDTKVAECTHIAEVFEHADDFDIIHNGFDFLPLTYSSLVRTPVVTTIHGFSSSRIVPVYERYNATTSYVAISAANRHPRLRYAATIHHGIDAGTLTLGAARGDHLLFFGRIHPDKGTADAIRIARLAGRPLHIAGIIQDHDYFRHKVEPHIDGENVVFLGPVTIADRSPTLGAAHALLHPIAFDEPFGFSVVEALACGTPVIAYSRGSMPELIEHRSTGFLVQDVQSAVAAVGHAGRLDRAAIRATALRRFDRAVMVERYVDVYRSILSSHISK